MSKLLAMSDTTSGEALSILTGSGKFIIRSANESDLSGLLNLWRAAFGRDPDMNDWAWKYGGPFAHRTMVCVHESGAIAAAYPGVPLRANYSGQIIQLDVLMDSMSDPAFRGALGGRRGLFVQTALQYFDQYGGMDKAWAVYGFPGQRHFALGRYLLGYAALPQQPVYLCCSTGNRNWFWRSVRVMAWEPNMGTELFDELEYRLRPAYPLAIVRDGTFLTWRFINHPYKKYHIWLVRSLRGQVLGYAVTLKKGDCVRVVDMLLHPDAGLVRAFFLRLRQKFMCDAERLEVWLPQGHFLVPMVQDAGLDIGVEPIGFITTRRDLTPAVHGILDRYLFYTLGDTDVD